MRRQLAGTWVVGSVVMGTVALILTAKRVPGLPFRPLAFLSPGMLFLLVFLVALMFAALFVLAWRTQEASWLRADPRAPILWALAVGGAGLAGWGFAAVVTFEAGFDHTAQLLLAYLGGGLPFALCAGMLSRHVRVNWVAVGLTAVALAVGALLMPAPVTTCVHYLSTLFGPTFIPL